MAPLARRSLTWALGCAGVLLAGCFSPGRPVVAERSPVIDDPPPRTEREAPVIPTPGRARAPREQPTAREPAPGASSGRASTRGASTRGERRYLVRRGDTLYSIAFRHELDPAGLARANGIEPPYTIFPGQSLELAVEAAPRPAEAPVPEPRPRPAGPASAEWVWPLALAPTRQFGPGSKGVDYTITAAQAVKAASAGSVVYAGAGIGGFARLIIVKHDEALLSAYSFNGVSRVREQQAVKAGDALADIDPRGRSVQRLHFEIRRNGEPVDPRTVIKP